MLITFLVNSTIWIAKRVGESNLPSHKYMMKDKLIKGLVSYPLLRKGNFQLKISVLKNMSVVVVGNHMMDVDKFFVKHFADVSFPPAD